MAKKSIVITVYETEANLDRFVGWLTERISLNPHVEFDQVRIVSVDGED